MDRMVTFIYIVIMTILSAINSAVPAYTYMYFFGDIDQAFKDFLFPLLAWGWYFTAIQIGIYFHPDINLMVRTDKKFRRRTRLGVVQDIRCPCPYCGNYDYFEEEGISDADLIRRGYELGLYPDDKPRIVKDKDSERDREAGKKLPCPHCGHYYDYSEEGGLKLDFIIHHPYILKRFALIILMLNVMFGIGACFFFFEFLL